MNLNCRWNEGFSLSIILNKIMKVSQPLYQILIDLWSCEGPTKTNPSIIIDEGSVPNSRSGSCDPHLDGGCIMMNGLNGVCMSVDVSQSLELTDSSGGVGQKVFAWWMYSRCKQFQHPEPLGNRSLGFLCMFAKPGKSPGQLGSRWAVSNRLYRYGQSD